MPNPFCWVELTTKDVEKAKAFYGQLFDWKLSEFKGAKLPYFFVDAGEPPRGGIMELPTPHTPASWTMYVLVDDVEETCEHLRELGGKVLKGKSLVKQMGWYAVVSDPQGAVFGLWQEIAD